MRRLLRIFSLLTVVVIIASIFLPSIAFAVPAKVKRNLFRNEWREVKTLNNTNTVRERAMQGEETTTPAKKPRKFVISGTVQSVSGNTIVVKVKKASGAAKVFRGKEALVLTDSRTRYSGKLDLGKIYPGGRITVFGVVEERNLLARLVTYSPKKFVINGQVTFVGDGYFVVRVKSATKSVKELRGKEVSIFYDPSTKFISSESTSGPTTLTAGSYVNVAGYFNGDRLMARLVIIKAKKVTEKSKETTETTVTAPKPPSTPTTSTTEVSETTVTTEGGSSSGLDTPKSSGGFRSILQFIVSIADKISSFLSSLL